MTDHQQYQHHPLPPPPAPQSHGEQYSGEPYNYEHQAQQQHSLVTPYQQAQQPGRSHPPQSPPTSSHQRQPSKQRTFSFQSNKSQSNRSHKSTGSHSRNDAHETHAEKEANRLHSKADPTMAISEAEPSAVQAMTKNSLAPLRSITHRDSLGNTIAEPDRSNPTRSRWERPLDTIRSFEAAIDGGYSRKSFVRSDTDSAANFTRRSSYYAPSTAPRFPQDSYYGGRPASIARPDSTHMDYNRPNRTSYHDGNQNADGYAHNGNGYGYGGPSRQRTPRMMSEPMNAYGRADREHQQQVYPLPNKDRSYETVTTAAGSGSSAEQAGYQTDPTSSDNSSIHRTSPPKRQGPVNDYGIGFNQPASFQPAAFDIANGARNGGPSHGQYGASQPAQAQMGPPPVPQKSGGVLLRKQSSAQQQQQQRPETADKRKSWFSRRFSKNS